MSKPFFTRFLESQIDPASVKAGKPPVQTEKYPSDDDELVTTDKWPSDDDEISYTLKYPSDDDE